MTVNGQFVARDAFFEARTNFVVFEELMKIVSFQN